jgi:chemotaxis protein MotB
MAKKRRDKSLGFYQSWGDLVALLMVFFVMLFSMSTLDETRFQEMVESFSDILNIKLADDVMDKFKKEQMKLDELYQKVQTYIVDEQLENIVSVKKGDHDLKIDFASGMLFDVASATLKASAKNLMSRFLDLFNSIEANIIVEGHTDNVPIKKKQFPSNWELSSARASSVVRFVISKGVKKENCYIIGYGETRPLVPNTSKENRAKNRRVRLVVEPIVEAEATDEDSVNFDSIINSDTNVEILTVNKTTKMKEGSVK